MKLSKIKHICFDVDDINRAEYIFKRILGIPSTGVTSIPLEGGEGIVRTAFFHLEQGAIEIANHKLPKSWGKSLLETGPGFHHLAFEVVSVEEALLELDSKGVNPLPRFPMDTPHGRIAFLDPRQTGNILIELSETKNS